MKKGSTTKFRLRAKSPPRTDWRAFDAMSEEERHAAAVSDPDCPPATEAQLARARRISAHLRMHEYQIPQRWGISVVHCPANMVVP